MHLLMMMNSFFGEYKIKSNKDLPITIDELKNFSSIRWQGENEDDINFTIALTSAISMFEKLTNRIITKRNFDHLLCGFHNFIYECCDPKEYPFRQIFSIKKADISSINKIEYMADGIYNELDSSKYRVQIYNSSATIQPFKNNKDFPINYDVNDNGSSIVGSVKVNFDAGYDQTTLPIDIKFIILTIASHYYNSDMSCADQFDFASNLPPQINGLINNFILYNV